MASNNPTLSASCSNAEKTRKKNMKLKDKVVVITGSSSGIGMATAQLFADEGAKLVINSKHNESGGKDVVEKLSEKTKAIYKKADVGNPSGAKDLLDTAVSEFGQIDILINNAGNGKESNFLELSEEDIALLIDDNLMSTIHCSQYAVNLMQSNNDIAKIINTSSIRGWEWGGRAPIYAAAKAGVNSLTRTLASAYSPNILVNAVAPGFTKTPNYDAFSPELVQSFLNQTKTKQWISVEEMAEAYLFLAKNDSMTGEVMYVDAGFRLK
ncbi:MAG: SDR family oxidoreductase [Gammaproteobacteria bacterium]|nr:SDR family oxidoreductase [Gammaproteobacteria bacterium]